MTIFAVTYKYSDDVGTRDALRTEHRDYLRGLADQGLLLVSGPFGPDDPAGALLLFRTNDRSHVEALVGKDPFTVSGVIADATTATQVVILAPIAYAILQTIAFSLYLYSAELYPTRLRAVGTGFGSAWLRAGSSIGPVMVGFIVAGVGIRYVFLAFAVIALIGGLITARFGIETKGKVLEELSP